MHMCMRTYAHVISFYVHTYIHVRTHTNTPTHGAGGGARALATEHSAKTETERRIVGMSPTIRQRQHS